MLFFISKAPERSLHYESRSKSPGLLIFQRQHRHNFDQKKLLLGLGPVADDDYATLASGAYRVGDHRNDAARESKNAGAKGGGPETVDGESDTPNVDGVGNH